MVLGLGIGDEPKMARLFVYYYLTDQAWARVKNSGYGPLILCCGYMDWAFGLVISHGPGLYFILIASLVIGLVA